jgi:hypothetical protein
MTLRGQLILTAIIAALAFYIGSTYGSKTETVVEQREVTKYQVVTQIKEVVKPDGTKITDTTIVDTGKSTKDTSASVTVARPPPMNRAAITVNTEKFAEPHSYTLTYERRFIGPVWIGASYNTKQVYGLTVAIEF